MADHFADRFWSTQFWTARYFQSGDVDTNAMAASLSGAGSVSASLTVVSVAVAAQGGGGGGSQHSWRRKWEKERDQKRRELIEAIEPVVTETQIKEAEKSDAATITLAERVIARPEGVSPKVLQQVVSLIRELQAAIAAEQARREAALQEEEAMVMLLLAA